MMRRFQLPSNLVKSFFQEYQVEALMAITTTSVAARQIVEGKLFADGNRGATIQCRFDQSWLIEARSNAAKCSDFLKLVSRANWLSRNFPIMPNLSELAETPHKAGG
jgi:hypothetical protein